MRLVGTGRPIAPDEAVAIARALHPDGSVIGLGFPVCPRGVYRVNLREAGDASPRSGPVLFIAHQKFQGRTSPGFFVLADFDKAREFYFMELEGDYDLFGDGSVLILSTPGHTLGHQSLKVKLASGGTIILAQDAIWMQENVDGYPAGLNYSVQDYTNSLNRMKFMRDIEGAQLFYGHDQDQYAAKGARWYK